MSRVLLIANNFPEENITGSEQRTAHIYRALSEHYIVDWVVIKPSQVYYLKDKSRIQFDYDSTPLDIKRKTKNTPPGLRNLLADWWLYKRNNVTNIGVTKILNQWLNGTVYEWIVCRYFHNYMLTGLYNLKDTRTKLILDMDDIPWKVQASERKILVRRKYREVLNWITIYLIKKYSLRYIRKSFRVIVSNPNDIQDLGLSKAFSLFNIPSNQPSLSYCPIYNGNQILFVANLKYGPNIQGLYYFVRQVWPWIKNEIAEAELMVVGGYNEQNFMVQAIQKVESITLQGYVENLEPYYMKSRFTISPVYWGSGTKIKVLESLFFCKTAVVTSHSLDGFEKYLKDAESLLVASTDELFAKRCIDLLRNSDKARQLGTTGNKICSQHFSYEVLKSQLYSIMNTKLTAI